jgi:hypothetical protein
MLRLTKIAVASSLAFACGSNAPSSSVSSSSATRSHASAAPSAPAARFASQDAGSPDVGAARLEVRQAGTVALPNGRLAVSDAFINDYPVLVPDLPAGEFSVELLVAGADGDERVAAARLRVREEPVASWRSAGLIAIDSGNAAFFDPRLSSSIRSLDAIERFNASLLAALEKSARPTYSIAVIPWNGMRFIAFSSGFGDGTYPVFLGSTDSDLPAAVVVDFEILPWKQ